MSMDDLVFYDVETPVDELIVHLHENERVIDIAEAAVVDAARAVDGEVWSPQLPAYRAWKARARDEGTDGDLLVVGSLGMGLSDEEREVLLAQAAERERREAEAQARGAGFEAVDLHGALGVRRDQDGYAIVAVDLHRFAKAAGCSEGLVVALPSKVGGVPVTRIAPEAFARRFVQGVGVRLLMIPHTVERIGANAFLALSVQRIHLGAGVDILGEQPCDLAGVSPRLRRREYSVDARNGRFQAREGSLFADGGRTLLFLASPYPARVEVPTDVERVGASAFAQGCEPPSVVSCGSELAHVEAKTWDDAVWLCPTAAPAHRALARRGVRLAGPRAVEQGGCWYDFDETGGAVGEGARLPQGAQVADGMPAPERAMGAQVAHLVAGPPPPTSVSRHFASAAAERAAALRGQAARTDAPSPGEVAAQAAGAAAAAGADDLLALPRAVEGRPLERIGVRALPYAPAALVVPDTVRAVERDNACRGTRRLVLPEGLLRIGAHSFCSRILEGPVPIPASVRSVGEGCFEYAVCRLEHAGAVVHVSADQLLSCFLDDPVDGIPFDFARYDGLLLSGKNLPDRLGALLHRLAVPFCLADEARATLVARLREQEAEVLQRVAREGDRQMVEALVAAGFIDERTFDRQIELLRACNRTDCVLFLMEWHREQGGSAKPPTARDRFAL